MLYILLLLQSQRKIGISSSKSAVFIILYILCKYSEIDPSSIAPTLVLYTSWVNIHNKLGYGIKVMVI